jgi:hypothetical protein
MKTPYEDLSANDRKNLRIAAFKKDRKLFWTYVLGGGFMFFTATCIAKGFFPERSDMTGRTIVSFILSAGFYLLFYYSTIEPRIIRFWERQK